MSIIDSSPKPKNVTLNNGATISNSIKKFDGGSLFLNGTGKSGSSGNTGPYALILDNTDFGFGKGDFTIEMWVYPLDNSDWRTLISIGTYNNGLLWRMGTSSNGQLYINGVGYEGLTNNWNWGASTVLLNQWSHLALVRYNGTVKTYINGAQSFSVSGGAAASDLGSSRSVYIGTGAHTIGNEIFNGYIDELRITKGIGGARYPSNFDIGLISSSAFPATGTPISVPQVITGLNAIPINSGIHLGWTPPVEDNGGIITDYAIQYSTDGTNWNTFNHTAITGRTATITGLINGTTYSTRVAPINIAGTGDSVTKSNIVPQTGLFKEASAEWTVSLGTGSPTDKYFKADFLSSENTGATIKSSYSGVLHITATRAYSDSSIDIYVNNSGVYQYGVSTSSIDNFSLVKYPATSTYPNGQPILDPVVIPANATIKIGSDGDYTGFDNFRMWITLPE